MWTLGTLSNRSSFSPLPSYCQQIRMGFSRQRSGPHARRVFLLSSLFLAETPCDNRLLVFKIGRSERETQRSD